MLINLFFFFNFVIIQVYVFRHDIYSILRWIDTHEVFEMKTFTIFFYNLWRFWRWNFFLLGLKIFTTNFFFDIDYKYIFNLLFQNICKYVYIYIDIFILLFLLLETFYHQHSLHTKIILQENAHIIGEKY